jgi:hypothetical protein
MGTGFIKETMFVGNKKRKMKKMMLKKRDVGVYLNLTAKKKYSVTALFIILEESCIFPDFAPNPFSLTAFSRSIYRGVKDKIRSTLFFFFLMASNIACKELR